MQTGTLAALGYPLRKQISVISNPFTLTTQHLNAVLLANPVAAGSDINFVVPDGDGFNPGAAFTVILTQPGAAILNFLAGNTYNDGQSGPLSLNEVNAAITLVAGPGKTWIVAYAPASVNSLFFGPYQAGIKPLPGFYTVSAPGDVLPLAAVTSGPIFVVNPGGVPVPISPTAPNTLTDAAGTVVASIPIAAGGSAVFKSNGTTNWQQF